MTGGKNMYATKQSKITDNTVTIDTKTLTEVLHCGRVTAVKIGTDAEAKVQVGKRVLWNLPKIQKYIDVISL
jgi:hypothetical protein